MIYKMLGHMKQEYRQEILDYMAERYVDSGRADRYTAPYFAETEYDYASDEEIITILEELGILSTLEF